MRFTFVRSSDVPLSYKTFRYRPSRFRHLIYYCHRVVTNQLLRKLIVRALGKWIGMHSRVNQSSHPLLDSVNEHGIGRLGQVLTETQCADIVEYLADKPVYFRGTSITRAFCETQPADMAFGIHYPKDVVDCPHIMELVNAPSVIQLATEYLGCTPTLSCLGVQWSFPTNSPSLAQCFHRDDEDWKYLRFLVYLTDVDEGAGPHVYVKGSHRDKLPLRLKFYSPEELAQLYGARNLFKVFGTRGTGIVADTSGIHKGELPTVKPRLILTFTFSILPNQRSEYKPLHSRHTPRLNNYTNRLFLRGADF